jgi:hypothetical protein
MKAFIVSLAVLVSTTSFAAVDYLGSPKEMVFSALYYHCDGEERCEMLTSEIIDRGIENYFRNIDEALETHTYVMDHKARIPELVRHSLTPEDSGTNLEKLYLRIAEKMEKSIQDSRDLAAKTLVKNNPEIADLLVMKKTLSDMEASVAIAKDPEVRECRTKKLKEFADASSQNIYKATSVRNNFDEISDDLKAGEKAGFSFVTFEVEKEFRHIDLNCHPIWFETTNEGIQGSADDLFESLTLVEDKNIIAKFVNGPLEKHLSVRCPHTPFGKGSYSPGRNELKNPEFAKLKVSFDMNTRYGSTSAELVQLIRKKLKNK